MSNNISILYVNARFLTQPITGVQRFAIEISLQLKKELNNNVEFLVPENIIQKETAITLNAKSIKGFTGHLWEQLTLPKYLKKIGMPILINLCNTGPVNYPKNIITIHDLAVYNHPEWFSKKFCIAYRWLLPRLAKKSLRIITVSEFSKNQINKILKISTKKIDVIYNAVSENLSHTINDEYNLIETPQRPYILFVGSIEPRKNIQRLINSLEFLPKDLLLIIVGGHSNTFQQQEIQIPEKLKEQVFFTGRIPDIELNKLYNNAAAFTYPSLYEGFGLPTLEAQSKNCPVLTSDLPVFHEILKDSAIYFNPTDSNDIAKKINSLLSDSKENRNKLIQLGNKNLERFSWKKSSEKLMKVYSIVNKNIIYL